MNRVAPQKAIVLSSGGLDSTTVMAMAKTEGFEIYSLSFFYGQRHAFELKAAQKIARELGARQHLVIDLDLRKIGGSALTAEINVPKSRDSQTMAAEIPVTYVPARNTIFLAHAIAWAEVLGAFDIFIGVNAIDYSGYPDCRREFCDAMERAIGLGNPDDHVDPKIVTPLIGMSKREIVEVGVSIGAPLELTWSCYRNEDLACGTCDSCRLRLRGFREAGMDDPIPYETR